MKMNKMMLSIMICLAMVISVVSVSATHGVVTSQNVDIDIDTEEYELEDDECFQEASKEDQELVKKLLKQSDEIYEKHQKEYDALDNEWFNEEHMTEEEWDKLDEKYETLDKKTGMAEIDAKLDHLYEKNCDEWYYEEFEDEFFDELTEEQIKEVETIENQIDAVYEENKVAYDALDKKMEELEKEYELLDEKTGMNKLFDKLDQLWSSFWN